MIKWTDHNIPIDLSGRKYIITGTSSGIGVHIAYQLIKRGAHVIAGNRNIEKAKKAMIGMTNQEAILSNYEVLRLDLSSFSSVRSFAQEVREMKSLNHIDGLVLNAGIMALPERALSVDGYELQMATNVIGHHLLTSLLFPLLQTSPGISKIVTTSSSASTQLSDRSLWDDLNAEEKYNPWEVYAVTKIAAIQFRESLINQLNELSLTNNIHVLAVHPGLTASPLWDVSKGVMATIFRSFRNYLMMKPDMGALPTLRALIDNDLPNGSFLGPDGIMGMTGYPKAVKVYNPKLALDPILIKKMWNYCNKQTGAHWLFKLK